MLNFKEYFFWIFEFVLFFEVIGYILHYDSSFYWVSRIFAIVIIPAIINAIIVVFLNNKFKQKKKTEVIIFWIIYGILIFFLFIIPIFISILFI